MPADSKPSASIQALIEKGLLERLPPTFSTFFFEQFQDWDLLFPAERNYQERLFALLDRSDSQAVDALFAPLRETELLMGVNEKTWPRRRFTLDQVDFLNRNPHYQEWRRAIAGVFSKLDPLLDAEIARQGKPRLVIVTAPADLPAGPDRTWLRLQGHGKRIGLDVADGQDYWGLLLAGGTRKSIAELYSKELYDSWVISAGAAVVKGGVNLSYDDLKEYRSRLTSEMHRIVEVEKVPGPRQLEMRLKQLKLRASEGSFADDAILAEFVRAVLLVGNGTLLINNTFAEWAAVQAIRRARPSLAIVSFGIRNKLKPFSSMLVHTDQETASPVPAQMDSLGTYVDLEVFYQYIWQEFERHAEYRNNTAYLFVADGMEELFCIAPSDFPLFSAKAPVKLPEVYASAKEWLNV
jgi:hypothetical protein